MTEMVSLFSWIILQGTVYIFIGLVLYADLTDETCKVVLCIAVVISCYNFMTVVNRLPMIGLYSNMMSKATYPQSLRIWPSFNPKLLYRSLEPF